MADPANRVVKGLGGRESLVTTLVCENPKTGTKQTLEDSVECPETSSDRCRGDVLGRYKCVEDVESGSKRHNVASNVVETSCGGPFEAVGGDSITDLLDSVVWNVELVAIGVEENTPLVLQWCVIGRVH